MNRIFGFVNVVIGLILLFIIQVLTFYRNLEIKKGIIEEDLTASLFSTNLIVIPLIFLISGVFIFLIGKKES